MSLKTFTGQCKCQYAKASVGDTDSDRLWSLNTCYRARWLRL